LNLYELTTVYQQIFETLLDEEANLDTLEDTLQAIEGAIEVKAENMGKFVNMLKADEAAIEAEVERLMKRKKARQNRVQRIKDYLQSQMELIGKDKITTPIMTISLQNNPPALEIEDEMQIPAQYMVLVPEHYTVDKAKVKDALKSGQEVPGAKLTQGRSLRIR
jgi:hypothetical protein